MGADRNEDMIIVNEINQYRDKVLFYCFSFSLFLISCQVEEKKLAIGTLQVFLVERSLSPPRIALETWRYGLDAVWF